MLERVCLLAEPSGSADRLLQWDLEAPDQTLWSERAREKYTHARAEDAVPLALLKIPRLKMQEPVFAGTDRLTLNRGAGVVDGTALPTEPGNVVLSAHRDSYFRARPVSGAPASSSGDAEVAGDRNQRSQDRPVMTL